MTGSGDRSKVTRVNRLQALLDPPIRARQIYRRSGPSGLEPNILQVLIAAELHPGSLVGELADTLALAQGTVSTALARLQGRGLIDAMPDERDARRQRQHVTAAGRALVDEFLAESPANRASSS